MGMSGISSKGVVGGRNSRRDAQIRVGRQMGSFSLWTKTTMSDPHLPLDVLGYIIDFLHDEPEVLKECCLVAKSWVPCARKYLFADIQFRTDNDFKSWKKVFPNPSNSPARYTRTLLVGCPKVATVVDADEGARIQAFFHAVRSVVRGDPTRPNNPVDLIPFHGFSPILESLRVFSNTLPISQVFDLISSLPVLKNLTLVTNGVDVVDVLTPGVPMTVVQPPTSPAFTGTLDLTVFKGMGSTTRHLFSLPKGLHFRKLALSWIHEEDIQWIVALVAGCSDTLECLTVTCYVYRTLTSFPCLAFHSPSLVGDSSTASIGLSKVTKLRHAVFLPTTLYVEWIALTLQTVTSEHRDLRQISIHAPYGPKTRARPGVTVRQVVGEQIYRLWLDLDHLLVQLWESRSIRSDAVSTSHHERRYIECLLPEITKRGVAGLV